MCRINRWRTRRQHIRNEHLLDHLRLLPMRSYIDHRQLRWLGHVARMGPERLPRKFLACWCPHNRPVGRPLLPYGESVGNALARAGITGDWHALAIEKNTWRSEIRDLIDPGYRERTAAARATTNARQSRRRTARYRPHSRPQYDDDPNPRHFVFGHERPHPWPPLCGFWALSLLCTLGVWTSWEGTAKPSSCVRAELMP